MIRITTTFTGMLGTPYFNTLHFAGSTETEADAAAAAARQFWGGAMNAIGTTVDGQILPEAQVIDPATGLITNTFQVSAAPLEGFQTGELLPAQTQGLLRLRTNVFANGRRVRGRIFIPGPTETDNTGGLPSTAYATDLNAAAADLLSFSSGAGGLVVYSRTNAIAALVDSITLWTNGWAVLRTRRD